jgi:osmotically-inducible protein OsmY
MVANGKLYTTVMEKLNFEPRLDSSDITISIKDPEIVVLAGSVKSYIEKSIAETSVKNIPGVKAVVDELRVDSSTWRKRNDSDIAKAATHALEWNVLVPSDSIKVVVEDGCVTLTGEVEWKYQKHSAWSAVSNLLGVRSVLNNITVKPSTNINIGKVKEQIAKEFERNARFEANKVQVEVIEGKIILKGELSNLDEVDEAEEAAWSVEGVAEVDNRLRVR